jgi:hypothetical protein
MTDPSAALDALFRRFDRTAWRLEVRTSYGITAEDQPFQQFLAGQSADLDWFTPWLELMTDLTSHGKRIERVRVIDTPPSDYLRWEHYLTRFNQDAGEDIRYLPRLQADELGLPGYDFWVFDDLRIVYVRFDADGRLLHPEVCEDPEVVAAHLAYRDAAWKHAIAYEHYSLSGP